MGSKQDQCSLKAIISPSVLASDFSALGDESEKVLKLGADWLHLDVMDGNFVPNISFGFPVIKSLSKRLPNAYQDTHLMVAKPGQWVKECADAGVHMFTFHWEAVGNSTSEAVKLAEEVKQLGMKAGLAIKPGTPVADIIPALETGVFDMALVMTVEPGFGGQSFMVDMMPKCRTIRDKFPNMLIQVDGGLSEKTIAHAASAGANVIVAGTACFKAADPAQVIANLRKAVDDAIEGSRN